LERSCRRRSLWTSGGVSLLFSAGANSLLVFLTSLIGMIVGSGTGLRHRLFDYLAQVMPGSAFNLIESAMYEISRSGSDSKLWLGILGALWVSSSGIGAFQGH